MSWDASVYLKRLRIPKKKLLETYEEMQRRFGAPRDDDDGDGDGDTFPFARFRLHLQRDRKAGMSLFISSEDVEGDASVEEAGFCMAEWAELLGGAVSEEEWNERSAAAESKVLATRKLPKFGPADTVCWLAFDAEGNERGKKSIAKELVEVVKPRMLEPAWLKEHGVVRVESLSFNGDGTVWGHDSYEVMRNGTMRRLPDE